MVIKKKKESIKKKLVDWLGEKLYHDLELLGILFGEQTTKEMVEWGIKRQRERLKEAK